MTPLSFEDSSDSVIAVFDHPTVIWILK